MKNIFYLLAIIQLLLLGSCDWITSATKEENNSPKIAQVGDEILYTSDLTKLQLPHHSKEDSIKLVQGFINNWIRKELLVQKAKNEESIDLIEIEEKIQALKNQLLIYEFQKYITDKEFQQNVSEEEILEYYNNNKNNFELKQNIIKGRFIKVSNTMPYIEDVRKWIKEDDQNAKDELKSYCIQFSDSYFLNDSTWINFNDVIKNSPFKELDNEIRFLQTTKFTEKADSNHIYFLLVKDFKIENETSPIEFYRNQIEKTILNKQKQNFFNEYKENLYQEALKNNGFKIHELSK